MAVVLKYNIHAGSPYREYLRSVHGRSVPGEAGGFAAVCTDCHGVHDIRGAGAARLPAREPKTCGACHPVAFEEYSRSIHGREAAKGNVDVPLCVDCHGEHGIAPAASPGSSTARGRILDTCSACHARPEIMRKYGVPEDRIATFIDSYHGIAVGLGGTAEATCVDCHGVHDILPAAEPESKVFPANLAGTCGRPSCHPDMTGRIAGTRIHRDYSRPGSGAPYYVQRVLLWVVLVLTVLTVLYVLASVARRIRGRSRGA
jgi:nitrate/TMAO reductase-like tetraheme cytochrome c subunit